jgi:hypothetical protein
MAPAIKNASRGAKAPVSNSTKTAAINTAVKTLAMRSNMEFPYAIYCTREEGDKHSKQAFQVKNDTNVTKSL